MCASFYPNPYSPDRAQAPSTSSSRGDEILELLRQMPDCKRTPDDTTFVLPVHLPSMSAQRSAEKVHLQIEVPQEYPEKSPVLTVLEKPSLEILDRAGQFSHNPHRPGMKLHESVADAYELLSGKSYTVAAADKKPASPAAHPIYMRPSASASTHRNSSPLRPHSSSPSFSERGAQPSQLQPRIRTDLQGRSAEDLAQAAARKASFDELMQKYLAMTAMGQRYVVSQSKILQLAQENKDLREDIKNVEQQVRSATNTELRSAQQEYDSHKQQQDALLNKVDVAALVAQMRQQAQGLDQGGEEKEVIEAGGNGTELTPMHVKQLMNKFRDKRAAYHAADIQASAAEQLLR